MERLRRREPCGPRRGRCPISIRRSAWRLLLLALLLGAAGACAAPRVTDGVYRDPDGRFQIRLPAAGWHPAGLEGAALALRSPELGAAMALLAECERPESGELPWVARHLFWGLRETRVRERRRVELRGIPALQTRLAARLDGIPVEVEGLTLRHAGCLVDFAYVAPPATFARGQGDFRAFVESWMAPAGR